MKTDVKALLKQVEDGVEGLKADAGAPGFSPQLGTALGGLRTAAAGLRSHVAMTAPQDAAKAAGAAKNN
jgi:hypothetical protein